MGNNSNITAYLETKALFTQNEKMKDVEITNLKLKAISYKAKIASLENKVQEQKDLIDEQSDEIQKRGGMFVFFWFFMLVVGILLGHFVPPLFTNG
jgi:hypothetical protein